MKIKDMQQLRKEVITLKSKLWQSKLRPVEHFSFCKQYKEWIEEKEAIDSHWVCTKCPIKNNCKEITKAWINFEKSLVATPINPHNFYSSFIQH